MKLRQLLDALYEAPIEDFQTIGDFNRSSAFRQPADRKLVTNPIYVQRVKNMFANTDVDFRMFFVNNAEANRNSLKSGGGNDVFVDAAWMQQNMPKTLEAINQQGGLGANAVNIIFAGNKGGFWKPMTGWIMAHRIGHTIVPNGSNILRMIERDCGEQMKSIFNAYEVEIPYGTKIFRQEQSKEANMFTRFFCQIGTMRSARDKTIISPLEFLYECFAQYLIQGRIIFNQPPEKIVYSFGGGQPYYRKIYGPIDYHGVEDSLEYIASSMGQEFDRAMHGATGKILIY